MDIVRHLKRLEARFNSTVEQATGKVAPIGAREPLEVAHAIIDAVEKCVEPAGRGRYVFPFNRIRISILAPSPEMRARFDAVLESEPALDDRICERLRASGCDPAGLSIERTYLDGVEEAWLAPDFNLGFERVAAAAPTLQAEQAPARGITLTVTHGTAEKTSYLMNSSRINLGRCPEVRDSRNRLIRLNHVAFLEGGEAPNRTVSRNHAHIECAAGGGEYRLRDDRSAYGTSVMRNGETIVVPSGIRGIRLQSGDEILLGEASLRIEIPVL